MSFSAWYPTIFPEKCDGCVSFEKPRCGEFCTNGVLEMRDGKAVVAQPNKCVSGCTACEPICHKKAISFPKRMNTFSIAKSENKGLLRKVACPKCGKTYWTNRASAICLDCEKP
ncbi:MAG: hypothetical protein QW674_05170 [Candidatus Bathyarchaeia archaeon]